jgi:hypothetical protein
MVYYSFEHQLFDNYGKDDPKKIDKVRHAYTYNITIFYSIAAVVLLIAVQLVSVAAVVLLIAVQQYKAKCKSTACYTPCNLCLIAIVWMLFH